MLPRERMIYEGSKAANIVRNSTSMSEIQFPTHPALNRLPFTVSSGKRVVVGPACEVDGSVTKSTLKGAQKYRSTHRVDIPVPGTGL